MLTLLVAADDPVSVPPEELPAAGAEAEPVAGPLHVPDHGLDAAVEDDCRAHPRGHVLRRPKEAARRLRGRHARQRDDHGGGG